MRNDAGSTGGERETNEHSSGAVAPWELTGAVRMDESEQAGDLQQLLQRVPFENQSHLSENGTLPCFEKMESAARPRASNEVGLPNCADATMQLSQLREHE